MSLIQDSLKEAFDLLPCLFSTGHLAQLLQICTQTSRTSHTLSTLYFAPASQRRDSVAMRTASDQSGGLRLLLHEQVGIAPAKPKSR